MALIDENRVRDCYALINTAMAAAEALILDLNALPGQTVEAFGYQITVPPCGERRTPIIEPLKGKAEAA